MNETKRPLRETLDNLPPERTGSLLPDIQQRLNQLGRKVVVLDDDPTGTQTVHDIPVLTGWPVEQLVDALEGETRTFFLLTNSRSLPLKKAQALNLEIGAQLHKARERTGQDFEVISRSDSTLRGHFPGELESLCQGLQMEFDAWLVVPFFPEGGRYTIDDVHYVVEDDWLVPAGQTQFARDKAFGYQASNLREWVAEKTRGSVPAEHVAAVSLDDLRNGGPDAVTEKMLSLPKGTICVANAATYRDLEVLVLGLLEAESQGRRYLYRTAASFVRVRAGIEPHPLLKRADLALQESGAGLVVAGSYVPKTSAQLETLINKTEIEPVEVDVNRILDPASRDKEIERARKAVNKYLSQARDTVLYTSRALVSGASAEESLAIGQVVSDSLAAIVQGITVQPRYLLAKGGITSSDIATRWLGIWRAIVLGQILPGVTVWKCGAESRYPGLPYIVFPGNVGDTDALASVVQELQHVVG